jgi:glutaredoxin
MRSSKIQVVFSLVILSACGARGTGELADAGEPARARPVVEVSSDGGVDLVFTWIDEGGQHKVASNRDAIPEAHRAVVRVQDPRIPPEDPASIWVADLREPASGDRFPVKSMKRADFEKIGRLVEPVEPVAKVTPAAPPSAPAPSGSDRVIMYATSSCPVCRQARQWLASQHISFVERNIERDEDAARSLQEKARSQGVPANGVPVFEIKGKLIPGFNKQALSAALGR